MFRKRAASIGCALALALVAFPSWAKVSADEAARLTKDLTPMGAERAGNADGTIPPWDGGITTPPPGYKAGTHHVNPFAGDQVLFTITAKNMARYAGRLTPGQKKMFETYPDSWAMNVYPTRRSASFPQRIYDAAIANATSAELVENGNGVRGATGTIAFPVPGNGLEVIWNHLLRFRGEKVHRVTNQAAPTRGGAYTLVRLDEHVLFSYAAEGASTETIGNRLAYFLQRVAAPARLAGEILLVHETLNQVAEPRQAWTYNPGQRRVRRAPHVAYDNPGTASDGMRTSDQLDMFNGAPNKYNWKLIGKKEIYVPYNAYRLRQPNLTYDQVLQPGHLNPDPLRYELHRVWVVDATVKDDQRHIYVRRTFYFDEDSWQILAADQYDRRGELWRVSEAHVINYYEVPTIWAAVEAHYDLQAGRYIALLLGSQEKPYDFAVRLTPAKFTPNALRRLGRR